MGAIEVASAAIAAVSAAGTAGWAFFRFRRVQPDLARADIEVSAQLYERGPHHLMRVSVVVSAVGQVRLTPDRDTLPPLIAVFAIDEGLAKDPPLDWPSPVVTTEVFPLEEMIESGEKLRDVQLVWIGAPQPGLVAYRVTASITVRDDRLLREHNAYEWQDVAIITPDCSVPRRRHRRCGFRGPLDVPTGTPVRPGCRCRRPKIWRTRGSM